MLNKNRIIRIEIILIIIFIILTIFSIEHELYFYNITLSDINLVLVCLIIIFFALLLFIHIHKKQQTNTWKFLQYIILIISTIFACSISITANEQFFADVRFHNLEIFDDNCDKEIIVKEFRFFIKITGACYVKVNPVLLKRIEASSYGYDDGIYPIGSGKYIAEYDKNTNMLTIIGTNDESSDDDNENYHFDMSFKVP